RGLSAGVTMPIYMVLLSPTNCPFSAYFSDQERWLTAVSISLFLLLVWWHFIFRGRTGDDKTHTMDSRLRDFLLSFVCVFRLIFRRSARYNKSLCLYRTTRGLDCLA